MPARDSRNVLQSESGSAAAALQKLTHRRSTPEIHRSVLECAAPGDAFAFNFWFSNERSGSFLNQFPCIAQMLFRGENIAESQTNHGLAAQFCLI